VAECYDLYKRDVLFSYVISFILHLESFRKVFKLIVAVIHLVDGQVINFRMAGLPRCAAFSQGPRNMFDAFVCLYNVYLYVSPSYVS
jgi:hypothetical protein